MQTRTKHTNKNNNYRLSSPCATIESLLRVGSDGVWITSTVCCTADRVDWICVRLLLARGKNHRRGRRRAPAQLSLSLYIYIYIHLFVCLFIYIYIYTYVRSRAEPERPWRGRRVRLPVGLEPRPGVLQATDGIGTPDPNPKHLVARCLYYHLVDIECV